MPFLHQRDDYNGFTPSCPPTFYNKIAPMDGTHGMRVSIGPSIRNSLFLQTFIAQKKDQQRFIYCEVPK